MGIIIFILQMGKQTPADQGDLAKVIKLEMTEPRFNPNPADSNIHSLSTLALLLTNFKEMWMRWCHRAYPSSLSTLVPVNIPYTLWRNNVYLDTLTPSPSDSAHPLPRPIGLKQLLSPGEGYHITTPDRCGDMKNNFPPTFLSASGWTNNQMNTRQINRRKCPKFITDVHSGVP